MGVRTDRAVGLRWTIGDVSVRGFEALGLSIRGAFRIFGERARYAVCVNSIPIDIARDRTGPLPVEVAWIDASGLVPPWLRECFDDRLGEGTGWKFAPVRLYPDVWELALDNDCILWECPRAISQWLSDDAPGFVLAEDVRRCVGAFERECSPACRNTGIRGLPPGFPFEHALRQLLEERRPRFTSELDEQGLQIATLERAGTVHVVRTSEVTICSPFWPHQPFLGTCGAHFVGLNARHLPWRYYDRAATECVLENWERLSPLVRARLDAP